MIVSLTHRGPDDSGLYKDDHILLGHCRLSILDLSSCLLDKKANLLYLVRDHAGIKPLYYSLSNKHLIFASEVKAFKVFENAWEENPYWRIYFLIFGHIPEPYTTLKNVFMLPKGNFLRLNILTGEYRVERFAEISFQEKIKNLKEAIEKIRYEFTRAVERHLISDAPIGVFLSGGMDSSLIATIAHGFKKDNIRTLSMIFNEKEFSEEAYQNIVLNQIQSRHRSYLVTEGDFIDNLDDIFLSMDQPTIDGVNTYFISKCAKEDGLKSVLSGLGGDELFGGYPSFNRIAKLWFYNPEYAILNSVYRLFEYLPHSKIKKFSFLSLPSPLSYYLLFRSLFTIRETARLLDTSEKEVINILSDLVNFYPLTFSPTPSSSPKNFITWLETNLYMQNQLLKDTDFMSMWHSVEVRVPFLGKDFMELVFSIKEEIKFNKNTYKFLLIKAFKDALPKEILGRRKMGFTFPFEIWMKNRTDTLLEFIHDKEKPIIKQLIKGFKRGNLHWSRFWGLVVQSKWVGL